MVLVREDEAWKLAQPLSLGGDAAAEGARAGDKAKPEASQPAKTPVAPRGR